MSLEFVFNPDRVQSLREAFKLLDAVGHMQDSFEARGLMKLLQSNGVVTESELSDLLAAHVLFHANDMLSVQDAKKNGWRQQGHEYSEQAEYIAYAVRDLAVAMFSDREVKENSKMDDDAIKLRIKAALSAAADPRIFPSKYIDASVGSQLVSPLKHKAPEKNLWYLGVLFETCTITPRVMKEIAEKALETDNPSVLRFLMGRGLVASVFGDAQYVDRVLSHAAGEALVVLIDGFDDETLKMVADKVLDDVGSFKGARMCHNKAFSSLANACFDRFGAADERVHSFAEYVKAILSCDERSISRSVESMGSAPDLMRFIASVGLIKQPYARQVLTSALASDPSIEPHEFERYVAMGVPMVVESSYRKGEYHSLVSASSGENALVAIRLLTPEDVKKLNDTSHNLAAEVSSILRYVAGRDVPTLLREFAQKAGPEGVLLTSHNDHSFEYMAKMGVLGLIGPDDFMFGFNALHAAMAIGNEEAVRALAHKGFDVNVPPQPGSCKYYISSKIPLLPEPPIVMAYKDQNIAMAKALFDGGADPAIRSSTGASLGQLCKGDPELKELLASAKASYAVRAKFAATSDESSPSAARKPSLSGL